MMNLLVLFFPSLSLLYAVSVCLFLYLWGERPPSFLQQFQNSTSCQWSLAWWLSIWAVVQSTPYNDVSSMVEHLPIDRPYLLRLLWLLRHAVIGIVSVWLLRCIRTELVVGGPVPAPVVFNEAKVIVVTGCNTGIGKETIRLILQGDSNRRSDSKNDANMNNAHSTHNHTIIMACRSVHKAREAWDDIVRDQCTAADSVTVDIVACDLSNLTQVREAATYIRNKYSRVDILINNAGLMMDKQQFVVPAPSLPSSTDSTTSTTTESSQYDLVMTANHLGHFLFTRLLQPLECVINVTSCTYTLADPNYMDDLFCTKSRKYTLFGQYAASKASNILFTQSLSTMSKKHPVIPLVGSSSTSSNSKPPRRRTLQCHAVHPGMVRTEVVRNMPLLMRVGNHLFGLLVGCFQKSPIQGAWNTVHALNETYRIQPSENNNSGTTYTYWVNRKPAPLLQWVQSEERACRLWVLSSQLVGLPVDGDVNNYSNGTNGVSSQ